jgi:hypothetical protein
MGQFDQTARPLYKIDGAGLLLWALSRAAPHLQLEFGQWDDTRRLVAPGEPDRTNDLVARMHDLSRPGREVWLVAEVEEEPERGILWRLGHYEFLLGAEVNPACDPDGPLVGSLLVNLTGRQPVRRWEGLGTRLEPFILDISTEDAAQTLARIEAGEVSLAVLPLVPLMDGGDGPALIARWPVVAEKEADVSRRVMYRDSALVMAELTKNQIGWLRTLEGWQMRESQYIKRWESVGEERGLLKKSRAFLLKFLRQLEDPVPEAVRLAIEGTNDDATLDRWFDAAISAKSMAEFRKAMNPGSP